MNTIRHEKYLQQQRIDIAQSKQQSEKVYKLEKKYEILDAKYNKLLQKYLDEYSQFSSGDNTRKVSSTNHSIERVYVVLKSIEAKELLKKSYRWSCM